MAGTNRIGAIPVAAFNTAGLDNTYQLIDQGLPQACCILRFINESNVDVAISFDGVHTHDVILTRTTVQLDIQANSQPNNYTSLFPAGTQIWVTESTGAGVGFFSVAGYYQK